jgi:two-component system, NarL family, response regulator DevR
MTSVRGRANRRSREKTVKNYVSALFAKLGMERRTQAAAYAARVFGEAHDASAPVTDRRS